MTYIFFLELTILLLLLIIFFMACWIFYSAFINEDLIQDRDKVTAENKVLLEALEAKPATTLDLIFSILILLFGIVLIIGFVTFYTMRVLRNIAY